MLELLDVVRVKKEYPELSLTPKNRGTIVDVHNGGEAYTVEFVDEKGETIEKALYKEFTESELEYVVTKLYSEDASLELQIKEAKKFFGLRPDQSFQDLDVEVDDDEDYICDDREKDMCDEVKNMSKEEREEEFQSRFGEYIEEDDNFEEIKKQYQTKAPSEWEDDFEKEKERIQQKKKHAEFMYCKVVLKLVELYGVDYIKSKIKSSFYATEEKEKCNRFYFCFENKRNRKDLKANYKGWAVYATIDVDKETYETTIVECQLP